MEANGAALLVKDRRRVRKITALGMRCDDKEIPDSLANAHAVGWWIAATGGYVGTASTTARTEGLGDEQISVQVTGAVAMVVVEKWLLGIVSPYRAPDQPSLWFAALCPALSVNTSGELGVLRKRPESISVTLPTGELLLGQVAQLFRHSGALQSGRERSFLEALGK